jgi:membrane protein YdbS with pleckstrin-like domain
MKNIPEELSELEKTTQRYVKRKWIIFCIRTVITIALYIWLWNKYEWVKWTLWATVPLSLLNLVLLIFGARKLLNKAKSTKEKWETLESHVGGREPD